MCFVPERSQQRALFEPFSFQEWSENAALFPCSLRHVLGATAACTFSRSQLPKKLRNCGVLAWKCVLATAACTFSTSQLPKVHPLWCVLPFYVQMCFVPRLRAFRPSRATNHKTLEKNSVSRRLFYLPRTLIFFLLALSLL